MNFEFETLLDVSRKGVIKDKDFIFQCIEKINEEHGRLKMLAALQNSFLYFSERHSKSVRKLFRKVISKIENIARELGSVSAVMRWLEYKRRYRAC